MFKKYDNEDHPWGSVAILGKKTMGSRFNNVIFDGGSGGQFNQYRFTSMFSVHNTKNIKILNSKFLSNEFINFFERGIDASHSPDDSMGNEQHNSLFTITLYPRVFISLIASIPTSGS